MRSHNLCPCDPDVHGVAMPLAPGSSGGLCWRGMLPAVTSASEIARAVLRRPNPTCSSRDCALSLRTGDLGYRRAAKALTLLLMAKVVGLQGYPGVAGAEAVGCKAWW